MKTESFHGTTTKDRHKNKYTEIIGSITTLKNYDIGEAILYYLVQMAKR